MNKRTGSSNWNEDFYKPSLPKGLFSVVTPLSKSKPATKIKNSSTKHEDDLKKLKQEVEEILPKLLQFRKQNLTSSSKLDRVVC